MTNGTRLVCPDCGHPGFTWNITGVQSGEIQEFEPGNRRHGVASNTGSFRPTDDIVQCKECKDHYNRKDLVPEDDDE